MDTLILIGVVASWSRSLIGAVAREVRMDSRLRYRLILEKDDAPRSVVISVDPQRPWIGRPHRPRQTKTLGLDPLAAQSAKTLRGRILTGIGRRGRTVRFDFSGGVAWVAEMRPHQANLVLLDDAEKVTVAARSTKISKKRIDPGKTYAVDELPAGTLDLSLATARQIDDGLAAQVQSGEAPARALGHTLVGVGSSSARLLLDGAEGATSVGEAVLARLAAVESGALEPVIECSEPPLEAAEHGRFDLKTARLLPWTAEGPSVDGFERYSASDAAATAGLFFECLDLSSSTVRRGTTLRSIVDAEIRRHRQAESRARADLARFADPERFKKWAEALLAGLSTARRAGGQVLVADPYDVDRTVLAVPDRPGKSLNALADEYFQQHRRAKRGLQRATERAESVAVEMRRLEKVRSDWPEVLSSASLDRVEGQLREAGFPVGLDSPTKRRTSTAERPRLEGVRLFTAPSGSSILVGKTARDNQRLTFKLAGPEDFWLHALDVPGAHVILRNDERKKAPDRRDLIQAAAVAAWFSEAKSQAVADVQWTRRRYVRKLRGGPSGTVTVKRSETVRVRPSALENSG